MSRHTTQAGNLEVVLGVDRPLNHVFASIFEDGEEVEGFDPFSWFQPTPAGVDEAISAVETFVGNNWKVPGELRQALLDDLTAMLFGESINHAKVHR
jgi:hypothetical protein